MCLYMIYNKKASIIVDLLTIIQLYFLCDFYLKIKKKGYNNVQKNSRLYVHISKIKKKRK